MIKPDNLNAGDRIWFVSPAGKVQKDKILSGTRLLEKVGFDLVFGDHVFDQHFQFAATDADRLSDLQQAFDDPLCKAIICSRGGYGTIRIADQLDLTSFRKNPKWVVGFSDITVLHALLQKEGFCSIHGAMPGFYLKDEQPTESYFELLKTLKGERNTIDILPHQFNQKGHASGQLIGGNLSILYSLLGTPLEPETEGKILFIEDLAEYLYHLDRMMHSLKLARKLENLNGLIVGGFSDMKDNEAPFGQTALEIIRDVVKDYNYPVCFEFPAGHIDRNLPLIMGANYTLTIDNQKATLQQ